MKILVVDDNKENLFLMQKLLKVSGYEVISATNGKEALEKLLTKDINLIISDILMPVMDGFQLCMRVKEVVELEDIPFIIYTATYTDEEDEELALKIGADKFIRKPVEPDDFMKIIKGMIKDMKKGKDKPKSPVLKDKKEKYKLHSERVEHKLEKKILNLEIEITKRKQVMEALMQREHDLGKRVKELSCLYKLDELIRREDQIIDGFLKDAVNFLPPSWQYPKITEGCITFKDKKFKTKNFKKTKWKQRADIIINAEKVGFVEVCYLEEKPESHEGPFLKEERNLIDSFAKRLAQTIKNKQSDEDLRSSEEQLRVIFELAPDAYYLNDMKGTFIAGNKAAEKITGYKREELIGLNFTKSKLLSPNQIPKAAALLVKNVLGQSTGPDELILNRKDGTKVPVEIKTFPVKIKDQYSVLSIARDITERKRAEEEKKKLQSQLQQTQRLEAIGILAGGIAHDFNNILSIILGYTELSLVKIDKKTELYSNLEAVFEAGKRAKDLVKQILTFSRQDEQKFIAIQLKPIIKEAHKLFRFSLLSGIELKLNMQSESMVLADPTQIHQVFLNLCTNANHAMQKKGGVLDVRLEDVELDSDFAARYPDVKPGSYVKMTISDTGVGMSPEVLDRIFDPFFTTKTKDGGTGMGLSVVHGIVKNHGGAITVYSKPGEGSTFNVFFPVDKTGEKLETKNKKSSLKGTERILLIDDEKTLLNMGKQMLESLGYKVTTRTSSVEALKFFKSQPDRFDLVITDLTMPNMTGEELAKKVLAIRPDIPVILCTGFSAKIDKKKAKALGFRAYLLKPVLKLQMAETIREVFNSQKKKRGDLWLAF